LYVSSPPHVRVHWFGLAHLFHVQFPLDAGVVPQSVCVAYAYWQRVMHLRFAASVAFVWNWHVSSALQVDSLGYVPQMRVQRLLIGSHVQRYASPGSGFDTQLVWLV